MSRILSQQGPDIPVAQPDMKEQAAGSRSRSAARTEQLSGGLLLMARVGWTVVVGLSILSVVLAVPSEFARYSTVCSAPSCVLNPTRAAELVRMGISSDAIAGYLLAVKLFFLLVSSAIGLAIFWRKPGDRMALFVSLALITFSASLFIAGPTTLAD